MHPELVDELAIEAKTKIIFYILDGVGGLPVEQGGATELEAASTPNLDALAKKSICGMLDPVSPGITPGSGPGHFALFGYDPVKTIIGRGILEAAGIDFPLKGADVAARGNFATIDKNGVVTDRRAGRPSDEKNRELVEKIRAVLTPQEGVQFFLETVKEHRVVLVLRGEGLSEAIPDTDPQALGVPPLEPRPLKEEAEKTSRLVKSVIEKAKGVLAQEPKANFLLLRGFAQHRRFKSFRQRYKLKSLAIAAYPMYRGLARLVGMDINPPVETLDEEISALEEKYADYDFFFLHYKKTDSTGEDGNFAAKVEAISAADAALPRILALKPDVLVITADHSTPSFLKLHSWHPVPVLLYSKMCRADGVEAFSERACISGGLGRMSTINLMPLAVANAGRLAKYGA